jgi:hypothetical protein
MPVWTVRIPDGDDELVEAAMMVTESGALVAFSGEGDMLNAWAPGQWRTVRCDEHEHERPHGRSTVLVGVPRG